MIDCSLPLSAKIFNPFQIPILWFWGKELRASLFYVRNIIKDPSRERECGIQMVPSPDCKPDMEATSLNRITPASVAFFWKYEAWHYLVWTTHGFCWLMPDIFLLKLCTFYQIVHCIIQNLSPRPMVQVRSGEHPRNSTKRKTSPLFRSFWALPPVVQVVRDLTIDLFGLRR